MTDLVFVDTNVLIYSVDVGDPVKHDAAAAWRKELWTNARGRISFQVLQEFYAKVTSKWPAARDQTQAEIRTLLAWRPVAVNGDVLEFAWKIQERYKFSFWDALIVSAAKAAACRYLLTEDLQAGQDLDGLIVINPFLHDPGELISVTV